MDVFGPTGSSLQIISIFLVKQEFISEVKIGEGGIWKVLERDEI